MFRECCVAVVDDHPIFRKGVVSLLSEDLGFGKVLEGSNSVDALRIAQSHTPDIMLLDLFMPGGGIGTLTEINRLSPEVRCVLLTASDCPDNAIRALNAGARGYILKGVGTTELIDALQEILKEGTYVSPAFAATLLQAAQGRQTPSVSVSLTAREEQVLRELEVGRTNREIAERLSITEKTVKFYMTNIMQKFGVKNRVAAVIEFQRAYGANEAPSPAQKVSGRA